MRGLALLLWTGESLGINTDFISYWLSSDFCYGESEGQTSLNIEYGYQRTMVHLRVQC